MINQCISPVFVKTAHTELSCGVCPPCRARRRATWTMRMSHELSTSKIGLFVTLTYDSAHLPPKGLSKRDLQLYFKRLRRFMGLIGDTRRIRYFACGEYGDKLGRPHYHIIFFGLPYSYKLALYFLWSKCSIHAYKCDLIMPNDTRSLAYVAGYVAKKIGKHYDSRQSIVPEFQLVSKGLGLDYALKDAHLLLTGFIRSGGQDLIPPRYYRRKLDIPTETYNEYFRQLESNTRTQYIDAGYAYYNNSLSDVYPLYHRNRLKSRVSDARLAYAGNMHYTHSNMEARNV